MIATPSILGGPRWDGPEFATAADDLAGAPWTPERIFREHAPKVYRLARRLLGNDADAEDATQEAFLQVVRKLPTFRGEAPLTTWLYRVAVNAALGYRRRRAARGEHEAPSGGADFSADGKHAVAPEAAAIDHETHELIEKALRRLPEAYRDVYVLADIEELHVPEIAELLGLSVATVKNRLHRAHLRMRRALAPYFEEEATQSPVRSEKQVNQSAAREHLIGWREMRANPKPLAAVAADTCRG